MGFVGKIQGTFEFILKSSALLVAAAVFTLSTSCSLKINSKRIPARSGPSSNSSSVPITDMFLWDGATCAKNDQNEIRCVGRSNNGELARPNSLPTTVPGLTGAVTIPTASSTRVPYDPANGPDRAVKMSTKENVLCYVLESGKLYCLGNNSSGQLGNGTTSASVDSAGLLVPVQVFSSGMVDVAVSGPSVCAIDTLGQLFCWGDNGSGQLGDGTITTRTSPVSVIASGVQRVRTNGGSTCAVKTDGSLYCWGNNSSGQLGDGTTTTQLSPVQIMASGVTDVAMGGTSTCAVKTTGAVECWGNNGSGQLGDGTTTSSLIPVTPISSSAISVVSGGDWFCAVMNDHTAKCWGTPNIGSAFGDGVNTSSLTPLTILQTGIERLAINDSVACAVLTDQSLSCWGYIDDSMIYQMGGSLTPRQILAPGSVSQVELWISGIGSARWCMLTPSGNVQCRSDPNNILEGANVTQGNGVETYYSPVQVGKSLPYSSGTIEFKHFAKSDQASTSCSVDDAGIAQCWGENPDGILLDGTTDDHASPVGVFGPGVTSVAVRNMQSSAESAIFTIKNGALYVWGTLGKFIQEPTPTLLLESGVEALYEGPLGVCVKVNGSLYCLDLQDYKIIWGSADINTLFSRSFVMDNVKTAAVGTDHACAITQNGDLYCWGNNNEGELGDGLGGAARSPTRVMQNIISVSAGLNTTCAIDSTGDAWCWGELANIFSSLGSSQTPLAMNAPVPALKASLGSSNSSICILGTDQKGYCLGNSWSNGVGDGTTQDQWGQIQTEDLSGLLVDIEAQAQGACVVTASGTTECWSAADWIRTGRGLLEAPYFTAPQALYYPDATFVSGYGQNSCYINQNNELKCWGVNNSGELGNGTIAFQGIPGLILGQIAKVVNSHNHTCALTLGGQMSCWGNNQVGQLGDGTTTQRLSPVLTLASDVKKISGSCALLNSGELQCWGFNNAGQVGDGTTTMRTTPQVIFNSGVQDFSSSLGHTCAVKTDGSLYCWGSNSSGQLGDGTTINRSIPQLIINSGIVSVTNGGNSTCANTDQGSVYCWGDNSNGRLGDGTTTQRNTPVLVLSAGVTKIFSAAGGIHTCAIKTDNSTWCWGSNNFGQLGDGTTTDRLVPTQTQSFF